MKRILLLAGMMFAALLFVSTEASAQTATQTLQPGRTYVFTGTNPAVVSHVDVPSGARYEFVEKDSDGYLVRFGFSNWRITVIGTGSMAITPLQTMRVSFNSNRLRLTSTEGSVLTQSSIEPGETVRVENFNLSDAQLRISQNRAYTYDLVILDGFGGVTRMLVDADFPQINIPGRGTASVSARGGPLSVYFPSFLYNTDMRVSTPIQPAFITNTLTAGEEIAVANRNNTPMDLLARTQANNILFRYTYVLRGNDGHVVRYDSAIGNDIRIPPRSTLYITPIINAELLFPSVLLNYVEVGLGDGVPPHHALFPGQSITVANTSEIRPHRIFGASGTEWGYISLSYFVYHDEEWFWGVANETTSEWSLNLEPGAIATITITGATEYAAFNIPIVNDVSIVQDAEPALVRYNLQPGESVYVSNNGNDTVAVMFWANNNGPAPDFVLYDLRTGRIESFGRLGREGSFNLESDMSILITSAYYETWVSVPRKLNENGVMMISATERQALVRHNLYYGQTLRIDNTSRLYNRFVVIEQETNRRTSRNDYAFEFTLAQITTSANYNVFDYGMNPVGTYILPPNNRLNIMPAERESLSAAFPAEWLGRYIRVQTVDGVPLHRITLSPGNRLNLSNRTRDDFYISNNSGPASAGFHIRSTTDTGNLRPDEVRETGSIFLGAGDRFAIVAAAGENLEIWMPTTWARRLGLTN